MPSLSSLSITYILSMPEPSSHIFEVKIEFDNIKESHIDLLLPVWRPGRYVVFDFSSGVIEFNAVDGNSAPLKWKKTVKCAWRIETNSASGMTVFYRLYANEFDLRTRGLDEDHGFVNGTAVFMYCEKFRYAPITLTVVPYKDWHVTTGLENYDNHPDVYSAPDYDFLADCPLEIGKQKDHSFEFEGKKYTISFFGEAEYNIENVIMSISKVIKQETDFWGMIPFDKYVFIIHCTRQGGGGTEHINSTVLDITPKVFESDTSYKGFLCLVAHEFFHTWNVKQLRPVGLTPYDYTKENYTEELWLAEGGTSYFDGLMVLRSGQSSIEDFLNEIARSAEEERRRPGNKVQSLAGSSFDAWVKFWKGLPQRYDFESDYYGKGADVALVLDLEIRNRTNNKHSLDEVLKTMLHRFPPGKGYSNYDVISTCDELTGSSFRQFFDEYVYGIQPIDWEKFLAYAGLELVNQEISEPVIGLELERSGDKILIKNVVAGSLAEKSKFVRSDEIISVDGVRAVYDDINEGLRTMKQGNTIVLGIFRNDKFQEIKLRFDAPKHPKYLIRKIDEPDEMQKKIFEDWLKVKW